MTFVTIRREKRPMAQKKIRGFAAMTPEQQREIASKGGRAAHQRGTAHEWDSSEAAAAGRKGGRAAHQRQGTMNQVTAPRSYQTNRSDDALMERGQSADGGNGQSQTVAGHAGRDRGFTAMNPQESRDGARRLGEDETTLEHRNSGNPDSRVDDQAFEVEDAGAKYQFNQTNAGISLANDRRAEASENASMRTRSTSGRTSIYSK
jgi:general stress protein YciG